MNQANTVCLVAITLFMAYLASILCFGINEYHLGGWGVAMVMTCFPLVAYALGRIFDE